MTTRSLTAAFVIALGCALSTSCLQESSEADATASTAPSIETSGTEPIGEAQEEAFGPRYGSKDFLFKVFLKDDGKDPGGGWQVAHHSDSFAVVSWPPSAYHWQCHFMVGMPLRTHKIARITTDRAALWSAEAANDVVFPLLDSGPWTGEGVAFCRTLNDLMEARLNAEHDGLGARVERDR